MAAGQDMEIVEPRDVAMTYQGVHTLFAMAAARHGALVAIDRGARRVTYAELEERSNRLANALVGRGLGRGEVVSVVAADPIEVVTAILGVLNAGGVFMPLDPSFPRHRLLAMAGRVRPRWAVVEAGQDVDLAAAANGDAVQIVSLGGDLEAENDRPPATVTDPDAPCSIYFTSGSTGGPKAILGRIRGIDHFVRWEGELLEVSPGTRVSQLASPAFDGFLKDVFVPLIAGGTACAPQSRSILLEPERLVDWVDVEGIEILHCVPSVFRAMLSQPLDSRYFAELRWVVLAGEVLQRSDVRRWMDVFGDRIRLLNLYGPTETTVTKLFHVVEPEDLERTSIPIGKPMRGAAALILDRGDRPCAVGDVGEITLRTPYRALGYYGDAELTRRVFVPNPFSDDPDDLIYRTGDFGRLLDDGSFEFLGRRDQQVKVRGVRVELGEIEGLLLDHPDVREAAVVDRVDALGDTILCAYLVLAPGIATGAAREHLAERLPAAMVPSVFIEMKELPRTLNGKIDRRSLPALDRFLAGRGDHSAPRPPTPVEEILLGIWGEVLRLPRVGVDDNFFELGGHSLLATQVILRSRDALGVELSLRSLFEAPTVSRLAAEVERARSDGARPETAPIRAVARGDDLPLSYSQQRMWLLEQMSAGSAAFNLPVGMRVRGRFDLGAFARTFAEVVRRHEVLRTTFPTRDGVPTQVIGAPRSPRMPLLDLGGLEPGAREAEARRLSAADARRPFDLATGPLLRIRILRLADAEHLVTCTMHHLVGDAWSFGVLMSEVSRLYESFVCGRPSPLPEPSIQYADYAVWQRQWLRGDVLAQRLGYWQRHLAGAPERLTLPQNRTRGVVQSFRGNRLPVVVAAELTAALRALSRRAGATLYMTVLGGFLALLSRYTGQQDLVVGSVIANRDRAEVADLLGFLANTLVLRVDLSGATAYRDLLGRVREVCLGAYTHQLPPEMLIEQLPGERGPGDRLFDVWFQMESAPRETLHLAGLDWEPYEVDRASTRFELSLVLEEDGERIRGEMEYDADLFDDSTVNQMREDLIVVLAEMSADPDQAF
jgi:amino acid adenylation domain-containing protein